MRRTEEALLQSIRSAHRFIQTHTGELDTVARSGVYESLGEVLHRVDEYAATQSGGSFGARGAAARRRVLRRVLEADHMLPVARVAGVLAMRRPEFESIRMPATFLATGVLVGYAHGMADVAAKYRADFVRAGLPEDFVERLHTAAEQVTEAGTERGMQSATRGGSTFAIRTELSAGRKLVRALDSFVRTAAKDNAPLLAEWIRVKRVPRIGGNRAPVLASPAAPRALPQSLEPLVATARIAEEEGTTLRRWSVLRLLSGRR